MPKIILCHCEDIEVEELHSAIEQGYGDLETLKRFTGIGTGKCQGKCCFIQTLRELARVVAESPRPGADGEPIRFTIGPNNIRVPTIRPPVLPLRVDDIVEAADPPAGDAS
jgi:bacterioferritin-associated ferredoxin